MGGPLFDLASLGRHPNLHHMVGSHTTFKDAWAPTREYLYEKLTSATAWFKNRPALPVEISQGFNLWTLRATKMNVCVDLLCELHEAVQRRVFDGYFT